MAKCERCGCKTDVLYWFEGEMEEEDDIDQLPFGVGYRTVKTEELCPSCWSELAEVAIAEVTRCGD